jgi:acetyl esterase
MMRSPATAYARRMASAGVPVQHRRFPGQMHGFFTMVNVLPGSAAGIDYVVAAIAEHLGSARSTSQDDVTAGMGLER